jgi:adenosylcobyric acid synthase
VEVPAYEIHAGESDVGGGPRPFAVTERGGAPVTDGYDGAMTADGRVVGTYLHGLFASAPLRRAVLAHLAAVRGVPVDPAWGHGEPDGGRYDRLADAVESAIDVAAVARLAGL